MRWKQCVNVDVLSVWWGNNIFTTHIFHLLYKNIIVNHSETKLQNPFIVNTIYCLTCRNISPSIAMCSYIFSSDLDLYCAASSFELCIVSAKQREREKKKWKSLNNNVINVSIKRRKSDLKNLRANKIYSILYTYQRRECN